MPPRRRERGSADLVARGQSAGVPRWRRPDLATTTRSCRSALTVAPGDQRHDRRIRQL